MSSFLEYIAYKLRCDCLEATTHAGSGHPTSCLSAVELAVALYLKHARVQDHIIWSKGHAAPLFYSIYAELGIITHQELLTLRQFNSGLEGHPTPRFEYTQVATGSLGQGLSIGAGMALHAKKQNSDQDVFVILGDSELTEGSNWEAAALAAYYKLDNIIALADINRLGQSTQTIEGYDLDKIRDKFAAFGWQPLLVNGHNLEEIMSALEFTRTTRNKKPYILLAHTVKGYGLDGEIEGHNGFHGKAFSKEELPKLLHILKERFKHAAHYHSTEHDLQCIYERAQLFNKSKVDHKEVSSLQKATLSNEPLPTRKAFGKALAEYGNQVPMLFSLDAEVKNSTFAQIFEEHFPERFIQCFVAEQNMIGMAIGFAQTGAIPFASTFAAFITRAHDQLRMAAIGKVPLRVIGSHAGVSIGEDGPSQMGLEDIALIRGLPDSVILYPCDTVSTYECVRLMLENSSSISYLRTTRGQTPVIYQAEEAFKIGDCKILHSSDLDVSCIIAAGITVHEACKAYEILAKDSIAICVIDAYSIKPLATQKLKQEIIRCKKHYITVEDHYLAGGLGEAIARSFADEQFKGICLAVHQLPHSGKPQELLAWEQIDAHAIVHMVRKSLSEH